MEEHKALKKAIYQRYKEAFSDIPQITMNPLNACGDANNWLSCLTIAEDCEKIPTLPNVPVNFPLYVLPKDSAASSINGTLCALQTASRYLLIQPYHAWGRTEICAGGI